MEYEEKRKPGLYMNGMAKRKQGKDERALVNIRRKGMGYIDVSKYSNKTLFEAQGIVVYIHTPCS